MSRHAGWKRWQHLLLLLLSIAASGWRSAVLASSGSEGLQLHPLQVNVTMQATARQVCARVIAQTLAWINRYPVTKASSSTQRDSCDSPVGTTG